MKDRVDVSEREQPGADEPRTAEARRKRRYEPPTVIRKQPLRRAILTTGGLDPTNPD